MDLEISAQEESLAAYLSGRQVCKGGGGKGKTTKKRWWCVLESNSHILHYKQKKDAELKEPSSSLDLYGATVYFGNTSVHEFILNLRGTEYIYAAENHKTMMAWMQRLQEIVKLNRENQRKTLEFSSETKSLDVVKEEIEENGVGVVDSAAVHESEDASTRRPRFASFFRWLRISRSSNSKSSSAVPVSKTHRRVTGTQTPPPVTAAPHRTVVGSMQDLSSKGLVSCRQCRLHEEHNSYLSGQVSHLNEEIENLKKQIDSSKVKDLMHSNVLLKMVVVAFIQECASQEDDTSTRSLQDCKHFEQLLEMLKAAREENESLPEINRKYMMVPHKDRLGFIYGKRETVPYVMMYICQQLRHHYEELIKNSDEGYRNWTQYASKLPTANNFQVDVTLKRLVMGGIPHEWRSDVWKRLVNTRVKEIQMRKGPNYYKKLCGLLPDLLNGEEADDDTPIQKQIKMDLLRTLPSHSNFLDFDCDGIGALHRILRAYLLHNPAINYCQGMNFMVAIGLLYLDEEHAFWLLVAITEVYFPESHYNHYLSGSQADQRTLEEVAGEKLPRLMEHLNARHVELSPISFNWFMTLFIDSLPVELVLVVWDCFLVYGQQVLYRFAMALLTLHEKVILKANDSLSIMRKLKKMGRSYYDVQSLLKVAFTGLDPFPSDEQLEAMYRKHFDAIEEDNRKREKEDEEFERRKQKLRFTPKPMMVSFASNLNENPDDMAVDCADCEDNLNFVWLCASTPKLGQIFVLNVASRSLNVLSWHADCRCLSMARSPLTNIMLVGTANAKLHAFDVASKNELWSVSLDDAVASVSCDVAGNVIATLVDGAIAFMEVKMKDANKPPMPTYLHIGRAPVACGLIISDMFWCACANSILVIDIRTLDSVDSLAVCQNVRHSVSKLVEGRHGVWSTIRGSSVIHLWDVETHACILTVDTLVAGGLASEKVTNSAVSTRITSLLARNKQLWVGYGNGRFIIFDVLEKQRTLSGEDDLNELIRSYTLENVATAASEDDMDGSDVNSVVSERPLSPSLSSWTLTPTAPQMSDSGSPSCWHDIKDEALDFEDGIDSVHIKQEFDDQTGYVLLSQNVTRSRMSGVKFVDRCTLAMRQIQRVSEEPVRCFLSCRNDRQLVLTCLGTLGDDQAVILWSCEKREDREMWFAQTVSMVQNEPTPPQASTQTKKR